MPYGLPQAAFAAALAVALGAPAHAEDTLRLEWIIQGQFAGQLVAFDKGYYKAAGADIKLLPAGSDIKPAVTVAQGSDTFGIGHPNQVVMARSHGVPLVMVSQYGHKSAQVYIARKDAGINTLADVRGKRIGSWFGGDEAEFLAMLHTVNLTPDDVHLQPEQDNPVPQLISGQLDVIEAVRYAPGDMAPLYTKFKDSDLTYLYPEDAGVAIVNTGLFTSEKTIAERPALVQAVVDATLRGWQEALADPEAAAKIVVKYNPELKEADQVAMIKAMGDMFCAGPTLEGKFGQSTDAEWQTVQKVLLSYGTSNPDGLHDPIDLGKAYTNAFWEKAPASVKTIKCK
ncbi:ABC transporter substrate-binding protein [Labrys wisconsinensis]|uniref:Thiamine pyrimidine synthase n=1 Tax=Labrys wisconsinensis TaxID=425677 RepID=A0ABU0J377_9HYPH|nr:ABC transporter substrate-binding protein [Labrys wisconsinensis]MDQ0468712.1 NitT/TauT family transport system substrate-binding protein [Labrys wisconsinensis]